MTKKKQNWEDEFDEEIGITWEKDANGTFVTNNEDVKHFISKQRKEVLDHIADGEGWEESREHYTEELGID